jgi:VIT1/CCC1 family predicted Fe2+/Mn2+ transporter
MKGDIIAVIASAAAVLGFVTALLGLIAQHRATEAAKIAKETSAKVQTISVQVDGRLSMMLEREAQLIDAMTKAGVSIPAVATTTVPFGPVTHDL